MQFRIFLLICDYATVEAWSCKFVCVNSTFLAFVRLELPGGRHERIRNTLNSVKVIFDVMKQFMCRLFQLWGGGGIDGGVAYYITDWERISINGSTVYIYCLCYWGRDEK